MAVLAALGGLFLIAGMLWDAFETIILPRRISHQLRFARLFFVTAWRGWRGAGHFLRTNRRESYLSYFGPLSLILLLATWAVGLVLGFGLLQWALGSRLHATTGGVNFGADLYMSGTTFFTLGLGDITPAAGVARLVTVAEAGVGFGFLALVIGYLPVLYQAFSRREVSVSLLDARAGSPPSAVEMLARGCDGDDDAGRALADLLQEWERWSAELLESHLSYPVLAYFRSQHEEQSWLAALAAVLDTCALVLSGIDGSSARRQAKLTFAIARHAAVDLSQVFGARSPDLKVDRLSAADFARLRGRLADAGIPLRDAELSERELTKQRRLYEPYIAALSAHLLMPLPLWLPESAHDAWKAAPTETA